MTESQAPRPRRGRAKKDKADELVTDPLTGDELSDRGDNAPVELEAVGEHQPAGHDAPSRIQAPHPEDLDVYEGDLPVEWDYDEPEPDYDEEPEFEPDDEEFELEPDYDEEADLGGRHLGPGREPRLATGPRHGPGHHDRPPHEHHGPGPKKAPGKKAVGKKAPAKKARADLGRKRILASGPALAWVSGPAPTSVSTSASAQAPAASGAGPVAAAAACALVMSVRRFCICSPSAPCMATK